MIKPILSCLCALLLCLAGLPAGAESLADGFKVDDGLAQPEISDRVRANRRMYTHVIDPDYIGTVERKLGMGNKTFTFTAPIELRQHYMDGTGGQSWPTLWEPESFCETLLEMPAPLPGELNAWMLRTSNADKMPETGCDWQRKLGGVGGVKHLIVRHDPAATGIGFAVEVFGHLQEQPLARGTLRQGKTVLEIPTRAIFSEASLVAMQNLAAYPALITAEVTDRHGIVHPLSVHRVPFIGHKRPILNVYDHYSGCVFERSDPAPDADSAARFRLRHALNHTTVQHKCDIKKELQTRVHANHFKGGFADMAWVGDMVFDRKADGSYALTIEGIDLFLSIPGNNNPLPEAIARGTARLTGKGAIYVDYMPADGLRDINNYFLITNDGLYRIGEHWQENNRLAAYVIEVTDMNNLFAKGDAAARLSWYALEQEMSITWYQRTKSGKCSDKAGNSETLKFHATLPGIRSGKSSNQSNERVCMAPVIRLDTCEEVKCLQWSDTMTFDNPAIYLTADETKARELWGKIHKWTRASTGLQHDPNTFSETITTGSSSPYPFGECGLEGCEAKRNREQLENTLIDMWND